MVGKVIHRRLHPAAVQCHTGQLQAHLAGRQGGNQGQLERDRMDAADTRLLHSRLGLAGHNCIATLFFCTGSPLGCARQTAALDAARACIDAHPLAARAGATSPNPQVVVVRVLAPQVEAAMELLRAIRVAWRAELWQLGAGVPRIWAM